MIYNIARLLQFAALIILPVAVMGNVTEKMSLKDSLILSGVGVAVFIVGWLLQQMTKKG